MIYIYDGSWDGLMCVVSRVANDRKFPDDVMRIAKDAPILLECERIENDSAIASAAEKTLRRRVPSDFLYDVWLALLSDASGVDGAILRALSMVWKKGKHGMADLANPYMKLLQNAVRRTGAEHNKFLGVTRFCDVGGIFYAPIEPDCDILPLLAGHFAARLSDQGWVIHDLRRKKAAVFDTKSWIVTDMNLPAPPLSTEEDEDIQALWREFYKSTTTRERLNPKVQRGNMPKKYWKHITENPQDFPNVTVLSYPSGKNE
ncbi:hypothetical protein AGMMS50276_03410 [Synergistales bacterium]|nr:hypothetical protein AGMMS50276_03410 [Synergistales bacterium]